MRLIKFIIFVGFIFAGHARAYVENIRHGYTSCLTCHTNPQGGSLLTPYGRALGHEIMFQNSSFHDSEKDPKKYWWSTGANIRGMQIIRDNAQKTKAVFIPMQTDVHLAGGTEKLHGQITYGTKSTNSFSQRKTSSLIRAGFVTGQVSRSLLFQIGKFAVPFGLPLPDHNLLIKKAMGFDQNRETHNLLTQIHTETFQLDTFLFERPEDKPVSKGSGAQAKYFINGKHFLSVSHLVENERRLWSASGIASFSALNSALMLEFDSNIKNNEQENFGFVRYLTEPRQGIKPYIQLERQESYTSIPEPTENRWAMGLQWLPRENVDLIFQLGQNGVGRMEQESVALVNIHLYGQYP